MEYILFDIEIYKINRKTYITFISNDEDITKLKDIDTIGIFGKPGYTPYSFFFSFIIIINIKI